jgi:hypothetical protein
LDRVLDWIEKVAYRLAWAITGQEG